MHKAPGPSSGGIKFSLVSLVRCGEEYISWEIGVKFNIDLCLHYFTKVVPKGKGISRLGVDGWYP